MPAFNDMKISARIAAARPLATTAMHGRVESLRAQGKQLIDFSIAVSHLAAPAPVLDAVRTGLDHTKTLPYTGVAGAPELRSSLAAKLRRENAVEATPQEIIVTNGAKQALYEALYVLTDPGDEVILFKPYWPAYCATMELLGLRPVLIDLPDTLTSATTDGWPKAKLVILNNPHNPSGKVFTADELSVLHAWMARSGAGAIVDESYEHMIYEGRHVSLAATCDWRAAGVVTLFSASQSYGMMGWRAGFALAPAHVAAAMETLQGPITAAPAALSQIAAGAAFAGGPSSAMLDDYRARRDLAIDLFSGLSWLAMPVPHSGPYLWGDVRRLTHDTIAFAENLLERHHVAIMPGDALGSPGFIRLGYISDEVATLREGIGRIVEFGSAMAASRP